MKFHLCQRLRAQGYLCPAIEEEVSLPPLPSQLPRTPSAPSLQRQLRKVLEHHEVIEARQALLRRDLQELMQMLPPEVLVFTGPGRHPPRFLCDCMEPRVSLGNICLLFIVGENDAVMLPVVFCNVLQTSSRIGSL